MTLASLVCVMGEARSLDFPCGDPQGVKLSFVNVWLVWALLQGWEEACRTEFSRYKKPF